MRSWRERTKKKKKYVSVDTRGKRGQGLYNRPIYRLIAAGEEQQQQTTKEGEERVKERVSSWSKITCWRSKNKEFDEKWIEIKYEKKRKRKPPKPGRRTSSVQERTSKKKTNWGEEEEVGYGLKRGFCEICDLNVLLVKQDVSWEPNMNLNDVALL